MIRMHSDVLQSLTNVLPRKSFWSDMLPLKTFWISLSDQRPAVPDQTSRRMTKGIEDKDEAEVTSQSTSTGFLRVLVAPGIVRVVLAGAGGKASGTFAAVSPATATAYRSLAFMVGGTSFEIVQTTCAITLEDLCGRRDVVCLLALAAGAQTMECLAAVSLTAYRAKFLANLQEPTLDSGAETVDTPMSIAEDSDESSSEAMVQSPAQQARDSTASTASSSHEGSRLVSVAGPSNLVLPSTASTVSSSHEGSTLGSVAGPSDLNHGDVRDSTASTASSSHEGSRLVSVAGPSNLALPSPRISLHMDRGIAPDASTEKDQSISKNEEKRTETALVSSSSQQSVPSGYLNAACQIPAVAQAVLTAAGLASLGRFSAVASACCSAAWSTAFFVSGVLDMAARTALYTVPTPLKTQRWLSAILLRRMLGYEPAAIADDAEPREHPNGRDVLGVRGLALAVGGYAGVHAVQEMGLTCRSVSEALVGCTGMAARTLCPDPGYIYVCGRSWGLFGMADVERFSPRTGLWEPIPKMRIARQACAMASTGGKLYVMGGTIEAPVDDTCELECFDPNLSRWERLPPVEAARTHAAAAAACGCIYLFGGLSCGQALAHASRFNPKTRCWENLSRMPTPRFESCAVSSGGQIFVLGGALISGEPLATVECLDSSTGQWKTLPRMIEARFGCTAAAADGKVFVLGGYGDGAVVDEAEVFDIDGGFWQYFPPLPAPRNHCSAVVVRGMSNGATAKRLLVFGGNTDMMEEADVDFFDLESWSWHTLAPMPRPQGACLAALVSV
mmetsp:Transcript_41921/g.77958  ORF Transcript_41921/g.77958 Transcript_41921/m.77958 type:complete len:788 (+) Transcript_41921:97-2460(+)